MHSLVEEDPAPNKANVQAVVLEHFLQEVRTSGPGLVETLEKMIEETLKEIASFREGMTSLASDVDNEIAMEEEEWKETNATLGKLIANAKRAAPPDPTQASPSVAANLKAQVDNLTKMMDATQKYDCDMLQSISKCERQVNSTGKELQRQRDYFRSWVSERVEEQAAIKNKVEDYGDDVRFFCEKSQAFKRTIARDIRDILDNIKKETDSRTSNFRVFQTDVDKFGATLGALGPEAEQLSGSLNRVSKLEAEGVMWRDFSARMYRDLADSLRNLDRVQHSVNELRVEAEKKSVARKTISVDLYTAGIESSSRIGNRINELDEGWRRDQSDLRSKVVTMIESEITKREKVWNNFQELLDKRGSEMNSRLNDFHSRMDTAVVQIEDEAESPANQTLDPEWVQYLEISVEVLGARMKAIDKEMKSDTDYRRQVDGDLAERFGKFKRRLKECLGKYCDSEQAGHCGPFKGKYCDSEQSGQGGPFKGFMYERLPPPALRPDDATMTPDSSPESSFHPDVRRNLFPRLIPPS